MRGLRNGFIVLVAFLLCLHKINAQLNTGVFADPNFFPLLVWLQGEQNAARFAQVGINVYADSTPFHPITQAMLTELKAAGIYLVGTINDVALSSPDTNVIIGWFSVDEPDDAQLINGTYGPCIDPAVIVKEYKAIKAKDSRPVFINFGFGAADVNWIGRGVCTGKTNMYPEYAQGADLLSFDIYPRNAGYPLEIIATGVDNLRKWSNSTKPVSAYIETTKYSDTNKGTPSFRDFKAEVWIALIHGATGINYFCHKFTPTFQEDGCLENATIASWMKQVNAQIKSLAPVLNSPTVGGVTVTSSIPVDIMVKIYQQHIYIFAVAMQDASVTATFTLRAVSSGTATVIDESRTRSVSNSAFSDTFTGYGVHLYEVNAAVASS